MRCCGVLNHLIVAKARELRGSASNGSWAVPEPRAGYPSSGSRQLMLDVGCDSEGTRQLDLAANATADVAHIWTELTCRLSSDQRLLENGADRIG